MCTMSGKTSKQRQRHIKPRKLDPHGCELVKRTHRFTIMRARTKRSLTMLQCWIFSILSPDFCQIYPQIFPRFFPDFFPGFFSQPSAQRRHAHGSRPACPRRPRSARARSRRDRSRRHESAPCREPGAVAIHANTHAQRRQSTRLRNQSPNSRESI
jgi:hypothetical protein